MDHGSVELYNMFYDAEQWPVTSNLFSLPDWLGRISECLDHITLDIVTCLWYYNPYSSVLWKFIISSKCPIINSYRGCKSFQFGIFTICLGLCCDRYQWNRMLLPTYWILMLSESGILFWWMPHKHSLTAKHQLRVEGGGWCKLLVDAPF